jgi:hypothetical protein
VCHYSPETEAKGAPKKIARIEALGLSRSTGYRLLKTAHEKRLSIRQIRQTVVDISWSNVRKRKGYTKVDANVRKKLSEWILNHHMIVASPNSCDTLLIRDPDNPRIKTRTSKLYLQISMRELHNDLLSDPPLGLPEARDADGEPVISDTALRALLPPQVRTMTKKHKQMCGCEICIIMRQQQMSLNAYRLALLKRLEKEASEFEDDERRQIATSRAEQYRNAMYPNGAHLHAKPKDALISIMCPNVDGFDVPHLSCILSECENCPKYKYLQEEEALSNHANPIKFHVYQKFAKCTFHGLLA